jgi:hypothetical protein
MSEIETMQKLHQLSVKGEVLSAEEQTVLQNWYEISDREEDLLLNKSKPQNSQTLQNNLANTNKQIAKISREIELLVTQNATLRNENQVLRKTLESRLLEKVA